ncbi:hypothetical protein FRC07_001560 [Ceratobasidium sp. 392]|nr:hypothetical protein FRC07_001560 [Ceratobasidium sp. 392]
MHDQQAWQAGFNPWSLEAESNVHYKHIGFPPEFDHILDDVSVGEEVSLHTSPTLTHNPKLFPGEQPWPDPWLDTQDPFGNADIINHVENILNAITDRDFDGPLSDENPYMAQYNWGMEEGYQETAGKAHQSATDNVNDNDPLNNNPIQPPLPEPLYNPYGDDAPPAYVRIDTPNKIIFQYASAGGIVQKAGWDKSKWQRLHEKHKSLYGDNVYGRWETKKEWDDAYYFATTKTSQAGLQDLLKTKRYTSDPPKFKTVKKLFSVIEKEMNDFGAPEMTVEEVRLAEAPLDKHHLAYLDIEQGGDYLFGNARFDGHMTFAPVIEFGLDGIRRYSNLNTGNYWNLRQRLLKPGTTLGTVVVMSDATQLSMFSGDVSAHGVYMSLANIDKAI